MKGTVTDEQGEPLIGASIAVKGTTQGVITDFNGQFSIDASKSATLIISYVGYRSEEVQVKGQSNLKIVLKEDSKIIDEVVVTALGIKRERKALGYSIGEVKGEELEKAKETNVINSLAGKIPGLDCVSIGPDLQNVHTAEESMDIESVGRVWSYLLEVLKQ